MSTLVQIAKGRVVNAPHITAPTQLADVDQMIARARQAYEGKAVAIRDPKTPPMKPKRLLRAKNAAARAAANPTTRKVAMGVGAAGLAGLSFAAGRKSGVKGTAAMGAASLGAGAAAVAAARKKLRSLSTRQKAVMGGVAGAAGAAGAAKVLHDVWSARTKTGGGGGGGGRGGRGGSGGGGGGGSGAGGAAAGRRRLRRSGPAAVGLPGRRLTPEQAESVRRNLGRAGRGATIGMSGAYLDRVATGRDR